MYSNAEETIKAILSLVELCPDQLKEKCFEVLLTGYVDSEVRKTVPQLGTPPPPPGQAPPAPPALSIPTTILPRFHTMAKRIASDVQSLESIFDFNNDPFTFHPFQIPGGSKAEKTRNVALAIAARTYLATGSWTADWKEVKATCVDQNCYDRPNHVTYLRQGVSSLFKSIESEKTIELTSGGMQEAEKTLGLLAKGQPQ